MKGPDMMSSRFAATAAAAARMDCPLRLDYRQSWMPIHGSAHPATTWGVFAYHLSVGRSVGRSIEPGWIRASFQTASALPGRALSLGIGVNAYSQMRWMRALL